MNITPVEGSGDSPLQCSHITSIAIGSIDCSKESLDSFQETDLGRLHNKWTEIFQYYNEYTQKELTKIVGKKGIGYLIMSCHSVCNRQWHSQAPGLLGHRASQYRMGPSSEVETMI